MRLTTLLIVLTFLILQGCITLYKPNAINSPLLKEKGATNIAGALSLSGSGLANLQASHAAGNNIGIMGNFMYHSRRSTYSDGINRNTEYVQIFSGEVGAGYFLQFGEKKQGLFQCYGGGGYGKTIDVLSLDTNVVPQINAEYTNLFMQPGIAFTSEHFEFSFDVRANYVYIYNINAYLSKEFNWWNTEFEHYTNYRLDFLLVEPTMTIKTGGPGLKGVFQAGITLPAVNSPAYFAANTESLLLFPLIKVSLGISYTFNLQKPAKVRQQATE